MIFFIKRTFYFANELRIFTTLSFNLLNTILIFEDQNKTNGAYIYFQKIIYTYYL